MSVNPAKRLRDELLKMAPEECLLAENSDGSVQVLTRAGRLNVRFSVYTMGRKGQGHVDMYARFLTPCMVPVSGVGLGDHNTYSGKWNHDLGNDAERALEQLRELMAPLWPKPEDVPFLDFLGAISDMHRSERGHLLSEGPWWQHDPPKVALPIVGRCGHVRRHSYCDGCGTDYRAISEREFWAQAGAFMFGGYR